ncbi:hypothetical protein HanXRQr2_Chr16g0745981 [Helianthus annuus]|uniref:Uncharacterized protein n=1 Tax=Helianthus annuus TaxID=4232 RepID=A0A9K3GY01_HELAN|nr:hypothetical protein HanXRQr2_Chr16g0745981 [Helianthus annuus]KAJ0821031.1 hypothetical protein HanPSC8_Chr16g0715201 [Helianthus annuus]
MNQNDKKVSIYHSLQFTIFNMNIFAPTVVHFLTILCYKPIFLETLSGRLAITKPANTCSSFKKYIFKIRSKQ